MTPLIYAGLDKQDQLAYLNRLSPGIVDTVCYALGIGVTDIKSSSRKAEFVTARVIAANMMRKHTRHSLKEIGKILGYRDHSTVIYCLNQYEAMMMYEDFREKVERVEARFRSNCKVG